MNNFLIIIHDDCVMSDVFTAHYTCVCSVCLKRSWCHKHSVIQETAGDASGVNSLYYCS